MSKTHTQEVSAPQWDLSPIYPELNSDEFHADLQDATLLLSEMKELITATQAELPGGAQGPPTKLVADKIAQIVGTYNRIWMLVENLGSYAYCRYSVNTNDHLAVQTLDKVEALEVPLAEVRVTFRNLLDGIPDLTEVLGHDPELARYRFILQEERFLASRQMTSPEEELAADLNRPGGDAWSRLQQSLSSELTAELDGEPKTVNELRGLAYSPDREVRRKAYEAEVAAWHSIRTPMAAALNGVKGFSTILNGRRGWESTLERSAHQSRVSMAALTALIETMQDNLPVFRKYLKAKARLLGVKACAFYDLFGPVGEPGGSWTYEKAHHFIVDQFRGFSPDLGSFAEQAFESQWIDAQMRPGKVGGAYCIDFPKAGQSRILANFDGSYSDVMTLAHELGHAYHTHVMRDLPGMLSDYPMTLAETASIFSETVVFNSALRGAEAASRLNLIEGFLQDATQVIVDILSRYKFESAVMAERAEGEISADRFCELMKQAQMDTYGDGLDPELLHEYMWAVKGHYYRPDLAFYNFPYAFGQLFGLGLYSQYQDEPAGFPERYTTILRMTGSADAVAVTKSAGFDIESKAFWQNGLDIVAGFVGDFEALVNEQAGTQTDGAGS